MKDRHERLWAAVKNEPSTVEDWRDLHFTIEGYRRRFVARHTSEGQTDHCHRCGATKAEHRLVNFADGPHVGAATLICPSSEYLAEGPSPQEPQK